MQHMSGNMYTDMDKVLQNRRVSVDELGVHTPTAHATAQFSSLPASRGNDPTPATSSVGSAQPISPLSIPQDSKVARTEENQSLMASIADALSQSHRGFSLEDATSVGHQAPDEPAPKYEAIGGDIGRSSRSEPHGPVTNGHAAPSPFTSEEEGQWQRRATRRSTSPPSLPPGAAPAAIRAWDDRMGQGEDGAHSDLPASSSACAPSQRRTSSWERDGDEEDGLAYDLDNPYSQEEGGVGGDGKHLIKDTSFSESGGEAGVDAVTVNDDEKCTTPIQESVSTGVASNTGDATPLSRAGSQWRIPRVPPPAVDIEENDVDHPSAHERQGPYSTETVAEEDKELRTGESTEERERNAAAAREVSREMDALAFTAVAQPSSGYATPRGLSPGHGISQAAPPYPQASPPPPLSPLDRPPYSSAPSSPVQPPRSSPTSRGGTSPMSDTRHPRKRYDTASIESLPSPLPTPTPTISTGTATAVGGDVNAPASPRSTPPTYRSPPPEYPRPTPPFSAPLMASSTSSLNSAGGGGSPGAPRTISAAAFRRQQGRSPSGPDIGPADTSPLTLRKPSGSRLPQVGSGPGLLSPVPTVAVGGPPRARLSVVNPDPRMSDEDEGGGEVFDYIGAYGGENAGYGAGRYVSDLEKDE